MAKKDFDKLAERYRVDGRRKFRLKDWDPGDTAWLSGKDKKAAGELLGESRVRMQEYQEKLYAQDSWALLLVFQAMDAAGKDGTIKHVLSGVNPQGCEVHSFKAPSYEELDHDYLWRCAKNLPERGRIGIFNRSYYEEVLVVRVHPNYLGPQRIPQKLISKRIWDERYEDINGFERYLSRNGVMIRKFFLNVSKKEQAKRFLRRIDDPARNWKFSEADANERKHWNDYMDAYERTIRATATPEAPWYVVPADNKWFTRLVVSTAIVDALDEMNLAYPKIDKARKQELAALRKAFL